MSAPAPTLYPGTRLRQLYDVALASPPATTALPLMYDPPAGRWKAQQIGTAGIADGAITFVKLAPSTLTGLDGRYEPLDSAYTKTEADDRFVNVTGDIMTGHLHIRSVNASLELGVLGTVNTPLIDFHSSANTHDFDVRLIASGGTAIAGRGTLQVVASFLDPSGWIRMAAGQGIDFADEVKDDKLDLYGGVYTIGIRGGTQAYFVPASSAHRFYTNNVDRFAIGDTLVKTTVPVEVGADSTSRITAEVMATRAANPTHGLVYLGNTGTRYLLWDTGTLQLQAGAVEIPLTIYAGNTNGSGLRMGAPPGGHQWVMYSQGSSAHLGAAGSLLFRNENTGWQPLELTHWGEARFAGRIVGKSDMYLESDLHISRTAGGAPATGVVYLGNANTAYLYFDNASYHMPSYPLVNRGRPVVTATDTKARNISVVTWSGNGGVQTIDMGVGAYAYLVTIQAYGGPSWILSYHPTVTSSGGIYIPTAGAVSVPNSGYCNCNQSYLYLNMSGGTNIPNASGYNYVAYCVGPG